MWGIGLLILLAIYLGMVGLLVRANHVQKYKKIIIFVAVATPLIYPFMHKVYLSHYKFVKLCEADDRKIMHSIRNVDYLFLGDYSNCYTGFKYLYNYKGVECGFKPKDNGEAGKVKGKYRYTRGASWSSSSCGETCLTEPNLFQKDKCQISCMQGVEIDTFTNTYDYKYTKKEIIQNRLYLNDTAIVSKSEVLAEFKNYTYYPYGNTWATILGASSGAAPKLSCKTKIFIKNTEVFTPNEL